MGAVYTTLTSQRVSGVGLVWMGGGDWQKWVGVYMCCDDSAGLSSLKLEWQRWGEKWMPFA